MGWYEKHGPNQDIVVSTRVRLARNLTNYNFPHLLNSEETEKVIDKVVESIEKIDPKSFRLIKSKDITNTDKRTLAERHLISPQLLKTKQDKALLINDDEDLSIVILDEDHLRIQAINAGFQPKETFDQAKKLAIALESVLNIAYDKEFGYLTACPTNVGTGLRVSALLHVPGLSNLGQLKYIIDSLRRSGCTVRGYYGEGSSDQGKMIQISNQITLGQSDSDLVRKFESLLNIFINQEREARKKWYQQDTLHLEDKIFRSKAILENAYLIGYEEAFNRLSDLRLGRALDFENFPDYPQILSLMYVIGVASLQKRQGRILNSKERDEVRAELIKNNLLNKKNKEN